MKKNILKFRILWLFLSVLMLTSCSNDEADNTITYSQTSQIKGDRVYILGVHPLHNPSKLIDVYGPLADYLSEQLPGIKIQVEASKNYPAYDKKIEKIYENDKIEVYSIIIFVI